MRNVSFSLKLHTRLNVVTDLVTMIKWQKLNSWHFRQVNVTSESLRTQRTPKYRRSNCHGSGFALSITYQPVQISSSDKSPESDQNVRDGRDGIRFSVVPNELLPSVPSISSPILVSKWSRGFTATVDSSLQFWKKIQLSFHIQVKAPWGFIFFVLGGKCPMMRLGGGGGKLPTPFKIRFQQQQKLESANSWSQSDYIWCKDRFRMEWCWLIPETGHKEERK